MITVAPPVLNLPIARRLRSEVLRQKLICPRFGILLHYDDSSKDAWALDWFCDPRCTNGYTWVALDNGDLVELVAPTFRTPHAGPCLTENANSAFYGLAATTNGKVPVTAAQLATIVVTCAEVFRHHRWKAGEVTTRIRGHDDEAIWTPATTRKAGIPDAKGRKLWGQLGRKCDPTGPAPEKHGVILDVDQVRSMVADRLTRGILAPVTVTA